MYERSVLCFVFLCVETSVAMFCVALSRAGSPGFFVVRGGSERGDLVLSAKYPTISRRRPWSWCLQPWDIYKYAATHACILRAGIS